MSDPPFFYSELQTWVNVTGPTAIRCITGNIDKSANLIACRADIRRRLCGNEKAAPGAFPVCQSAPGTNISFKPAVSSVTAICTLRFPFYIFQNLHLTPLSLCTLINFLIGIRVNFIFENFFSDSIAGILARYDIIPGFYAAVNPNNARVAFTKLLFARLQNVLRSVPLILYGYDSFLWFIQIVFIIYQYVLGLPPLFVFRSRCNDNRDRGIDDYFLSDTSHIKIAGFASSAHHHHIDLFIINEIENF